MIKYLVLWADQDWDDMAVICGWVGEYSPFGIFDTIEAAERVSGVKFFGGREASRQVSNHERTHFKIKEVPYYAV